MIRKVSAFLILGLLFVVFVSQVNAQDAVFATNFPSINKEKIQHEMYSNAYSFFESEERWYTLNLEYKREDSKRMYFGGFVSDSGNEEWIGKWISGSVLKEEIVIHNSSLAVQEFVY